MRALEDYYYEDHVPGPEGICLIEGALNPMPPTVPGLEARINANYPSAAITYISILSEPLCRCEGPYEYLYYYPYGKGSKKYYPDSLDQYYTQNGIFIVPKMNAPCGYYRRQLGAEERDLSQGGVFPCFSY